MPVDGDMATTVCGEFGKQISEKLTSPLRVITGSIGTTRLCLPPAGSETIA